ncbi:MAG: hypothetical protein K2I96_14895 [Lachnospiraceae bacterium]|nr:hypothetical protein [Lachnospiraceae bacterium]
MITSAKVLSLIPCDKLHMALTSALKRQKVKQAHRRLSGRWNPPEGFEGLVFAGKNDSRSGVPVSLNP